MPYQGEKAPIQIGWDGLSGSHDLTKVGANQLVEALNITYAEGGISKEGGAAKYNAVVISGAPQVLAGQDFWPTDVLQRQLVVLSDGTYKKDDGSGAFGTTLAAGLSLVTGFYPSFVIGGKESSGRNRKAFLYSGTNQVKVLSVDGVVANNIATPPADWAATFPTTGDIHANRHWGAGNASDPHRLYYTSLTDHEDFVAGGSLPVYPGEGEKIVKVKSFKNRLMVFKYPTGIYVIDTSDPSAVNWGTSVYSRGVGCAGPTALVDIDEDLLFIDPAGLFHLLSAVREYGDFGMQPFSNLNDSNMDVFIRENVNISQLPRVQGIFYPTKREVHFIVAGIGQTSFNRRLTVDFNRIQFPRFRWNNRDVNKSIWTRKDASFIPRPVWGDESGFLWLGDQAAKSLAGAGYNSQFSTGDMDLSHVDPVLATLNKNFAYLEVIAPPKGNWNLFVDVYYDGVLKLTKTFNMGTSGSALGGFTLGTDILAGDQVIRRRRRLGGSATRIRLVCRNDGANEDFIIPIFIIYFTRGNEKVK